MEESEETVLDANDLIKFGSEFLSKQSEFRGYVIFTLLEIEDLMDSIIIKHFIKNQYNNQFYGVVLPTISSRNKIDIVQSIVEILNFNKTNSKFKNLKSNLHELFDFRNDIAHRYPSILDDMVTSKNNKSDITIKKYKNGQVFLNKITEQQQNEMKSKIQQSISDLHELVANLENLKNQQ